VYCERVAVKVMSGGDVKASPRCSNKSLRELKAQEGIEWLAGLNRLSATTDCCSDQRLEDDAGESGISGATRWEETFVNVMKARLVDEASRLGSRENP
jgi:hypothetical protein